MEMKITKKLISIALAFCVLTMIAVAMNAYDTEMVINSSAGDNLSENTTETVEQWIPTIIALTMVGIALSALGVQQYYRRQ